MMKYAALLALTLFTVMPAARAQAIDPQAQILKNQIEGIIAGQKAAARKNGCNLDTKGNVTVEKADGYYAFTLPHMTYTDAQGVRSEIGMVAVNATPDGADNWRVSLALPTPINSFDKSGKQMVRTDIGSQNATGIWNTKLGHFINMNATLGNWRIDDLIEKNTITIETAKITSNLGEIEQGVWTGKADSTLGNISFYNGLTNFTGTLPKITMTTNLADRAGVSALTEQEISTRLQNGGVDGYNIIKTIMGAPERIQAVVTGLDSVNTQLQQAMLTAPASQRQLFLGSILGVSAVGGIGRPVANDASSKSYDLVFTQDGGMTINGTDFGSLLTAKR